MLSLNEPLPQESASATPASAAPGIVVPPPRALHNLMQRQISGKLLVREVDEQGISWRLQSGKGLLHFATSEIGERERLAYILQRTGSHLLNEIEPIYQNSAYDFFRDCHQAQKASLEHLRSLVRLFSQEALIHILSLPQAIVQFDRAPELGSVLVEMPLRELIAPIAQQIGAWQQLRPQISSPFQRLSLTHPAAWSKDQEQLFSVGLGLQGGPSLASLLESKPCLYELATQLNVDLLQLASLASKGINSGILSSSSFTRTERQAPQITIACIDDSATVQRNVKLILEAANYRVLGLMDPLQALSQLVKEKPSLILMDINMPNLDGYELSRLLRQSSLLKHTPIIMLTGRDGFVDKVRARVAGAADYITKPFDATALMDVILKHLKLEVIQP